MDNMDEIIRRLRNLTTTLTRIGHKVELRKNIIASPIIANKSMTVWNLIIDGVTVMMSPNIRDISHMITELIGWVPVGDIIRLRMEDIDAELSELSSKKDAKEHRRTFAALADESARLHEMLDPDPDVVQL